jgi:hypothetical protein
MPMLAPPIPRMKPMLTQQQPAPDMAQQPQQPAAPFVWGSGGERLSPADVAKKRQIAQAMMQEGSSYAPVQHWTQGLARVAQALAGGLEERRANEAETEGRAHFKDQLAQLLAAQGAPGADMNALRPQAVAAYDDPYATEGAKAMLAPQFTPNQNGGPFSGSGFEAQSANIIVRGTKDPSVRSTPEYAIAYSNLTTPRVVTDANGRQMLYKPEVPQGVLPPLAGTQQPEPMRPPMQGPPQSPQNAPRGRAPASAGFEPDQHPELYGGLPAVPEGQIAQPGGGTVTPIAGTGMRPTEQQTKNASQYAKSAASNTTLGNQDAMQNYLDASNGVVRSVGADFLQGGQAQAYKQAGDEWVIATLRPESGAVLGPSEIENYAKTYVPQWGDKPEIIEQKKVARARAVDGLRAGLSAEQIIAAEKNISSHPNPVFRNDGASPDGSNINPSGITIRRVR